MTALATLLEHPFDLPRERSRALLLERLTELDASHLARCEPLARIRVALGTETHPIRSVDDLPFLPVGLFKRVELKSVPDDRVLRVLRSSGTSSHVPSRIYLDRETASLQARALVSVLKPFLGPARLPMVIVDSAQTVADRSDVTARAAAILGFSIVGRDHFYLLDADLRPDWDGLDAFLARHPTGKILFFGFTFIVWTHLVEAAAAAGRGLALDRTVLFHGGGWKRLEHARVSRAELRERLASELGIRDVHDYYGMVEQTGSVFVECARGRLHAPSFADVIARDPRTFAPLPFGARGVLQLLSALPESYPGHSLLTEDVGAVLGDDDCGCGLLGRTVSVEGRLARAEPRGCSDAFARREEAP